MNSTHPLPSPAFEPLLFQQLHITIYQTLQTCIPIYLHSCISSTYISISYIVSQPPYQKFQFQTKTVNTPKLSIHLQQPNPTNPKTQVLNLPTHHLCHRTFCQLHEPEHLIQVPTSISYHQPIISLHWLRHHYRNLNNHFAILFADKL